MMAVTLSSTAAGLDPGRPIELFELRNSVDAPSYNVAPDGECFIGVAHNGFEELERLVPATR